jgi:hypothetical protein
MTVTDIQRYAGAPAPARIGQATAVEQSRAVAEVQAAVIVAQQFPRSTTAAIEAMQEACTQPELAGRAFFRMPRGEQTVSGPSVHLARELARCWGNVQHGITELARDDERGESEMRAWAWDLQTNTTSSSTFIVPHKRDTKKGVKELTDMQAIYENNANNGARRLREAIFSVLPTWYVERAKALCQQTNEGGGGRPLAQRIADAVKAFEKLRVSPARIAAKFGCQSVDELTATDVAELAVVYDSLKQGTVTVDDEFPEEAGRIKPEDLAPSKNVPPAGTETPAPHASASTPAEEPPAGGTSQPATTGQVGIVNGLLEKLGLPGDENRDARVRVVSRLLPGRRQLTSTKQMTRDEAAYLREKLQGCQTPEDLDLLIAEAELARDPMGDGGE